MKNIATILASALALASVHAATIPATSRNSTATSSCLRARDGDDFDTEVEIGPNTVTATWQYIDGTTRENHPGTEAFTVLFDNIYNMCGTTQCGLDQSQPMQYCTAPINEDIWDGNEQICLEAMGSFGSASKDDMFNLGRAAFDGSVNRVYPPDIDGGYPGSVEESGASFIHIVTGTGHNGGASGFDLSFNLYYEQNDEGCGPIVDRINQVGSIAAPDLAPAFGFIGLVCSL